MDILSEYALAIKNGRLNLILPLPYTPLVPTESILETSYWWLGIISIPAPKSSEYRGQREF